MEDGSVSLSGGAVSEPFRVGAKGRVVLPSAVRRAASIDEGAEVVARFVGPGQLLIETRAAVRARVWQAAPGAGELDVIADVRFMRSEDIEIVRRNTELQEKHLGSEADSAAAGERLLKHLGL